MQTSRQGEDFIASFDYFPRARRNGEGQLVIGHGHVCGAWKGARVCRKEARDLLRYDLMRIEPQLNRLLEERLSSHQFDALASLAHDMGVEALEHTPVFVCLKAGQTRAAATCFDIMGQRRNPARRAAEKNLFLKAEPGHAGIAPNRKSRFTGIASLFLMAAGAGGLVPFAEADFVRIHLDAATFLLGAWLYLACAGFPVSEELQPASGTRHI